MTSTERDFDRIARAWLDMGPNEAPDRAVDAVLQAIETTSQVRRPFRWPTWRSTTMTRITLLAVLAGTIALLIGGLVITGGRTGPSPTVVPSEAPAAAATSSPSTGPGGPIPDALVGGWVGADREVGSRPPGTASIAIGALDGNPDAVDFEIDGLMPADLEEVEPGVIRLTSTFASLDCALGDVGTYRWSVSADSQWLTAELVDEACPSRAAVFPGAWQRSLTHDSQGGPGIFAGFQPSFTATLPAKTWLGRPEVDTMIADSEDATFKVWKDLDGFLDPCDISKGRLLIGPGMDAFLAYLTGDPRFTDVTQEEMTIDGRRAVAVRFRLGDDIEAPCWTFDGNENDRTGVLTWTIGAGTGGFWNGQLKTDGFLVVTEVDGATLTFEPGVMVDGQWTIDRDTLDTVRFVDALPTPPAS